MMKCIMDENCSARTSSSVAGTPPVHLELHQTPQLKWGSVRGRRPALSDWGSRCPLRTQCESYAAWRTEEGTTSISTSYSWYIEYESLTRWPATTGKAVSAMWTRPATIAGGRESSTSLRSSMIAKLGWMPDTRAVAPPQSASMHVWINDSGRLATRRSMEKSTGGSGMVTPMAANHTVRASSEMPKAAADLNLRHEGVPAGLGGTPGGDGPGKPNTSEGASAVGGAARSQSTGGPRPHAGHE
jgi:hypothetical protein